MKQVTQHNKTGEILIESLPIPALRAGHVLVKVRYSLISAGTEKASISQRKASLLEKAKKNPELVCSGVCTKTAKYSSDGYSCPVVISRSIFKMARAM